MVLVNFTMKISLYYIFETQRRKQKRQEQARATKDDGKTIRVYKKKAPSSKMCCNICCNICYVIKIMLKLEICVDIGAILL